MHMENGLHSNVAQHSYHGLSQKGLSDIHTTSVALVQRIQKISSRHYYRNVKNMLMR